MQLLVSAVLSFLLMDTGAFAENREIYRNQVSNRWMVSGTYNNGQLSPQLRVPRCSAQFTPCRQKAGDAHCV